MEACWRYDDSDDEDDELNTSIAYGRSSSSFLFSFRSCIFFCHCCCSVDCAAEQDLEYVYYCCVFYHYLIGIVRVWAAIVPLSCYFLQHFLSSRSLLALLCSLTCLLPSSRSAYFSFCVFFPNLIAFCEKDTKREKKNGQTVKRKNKRTKERKKKEKLNFYSFHLQSNNLPVPTRIPVHQRNHLFRAKYAETKRLAIIMV